MSTQNPPFENLGEYAHALAPLVPDPRARRADMEFVRDAVRQFSDDMPRAETTDIGDGTTREWALGASPFTGWYFGFSESRRVVVEELVSGATSPEGPIIIDDDGRAYRIEERIVSNSPALFLVFECAPPATKYRVRWLRKWTVDETSNDIRIGHQMAVVYLAAALKCEHLATVYLPTRNSGSDLFDAATRSDDYTAAAKRYRALYTREARTTRRLTTGRVRTKRMGIFGRSVR